MDNNQYPATGGLFAQKEKRTDKSPGNDLIKQKEEGIDQPKINLVGWKKLSKAGNPYLRLIGNIERERQEQQNGYVEPNKPQQQTPSKDELDDEIPF
mgnify:CR=1 FL=1